MLRRPAARVRVRRPAAREPERPLAEQGWLLIRERDMSGVKLGEDLMVELCYEGERGQAYCRILDRVEDDLGHWLGVNLRGTNLAGLRHWKLNRGGGGARLYISQNMVDEDKRLLHEGLGYVEKFKVTAEQPQEGWALNCEDVPAAAEAVQETGDLIKAAQDLGFEGGGRGVSAGPSRGENAPGPPLTTEARPSTKRKRVRAMIAQAKWSPKGTPLDPRYKREISLKLKKRKQSSSSGTTSSGSESSSQGIGDEHRLKTIAKRLPGYLARRSAKEALDSLAQGTGESLESYQIFVRYHRQVVASRGGARPLLREMLTLATLMDTLLKGDILQSLDVIAQRLKSLELLQQGAEGEVGRQLELIPAEVSSLATTSEARFARAEHHADQKLKRQLWDKPRPPYQPGGWKGQGKTETPGSKGAGKKGGKETKGKGEKGKESKVVKVDS